MKVAIDFKRLLFISLAFALFTAVGTVSHEYGHILMAKSIGYETTLHYASMNSKNSELINKLTEIYKENKVDIKNGSDFDQKAEYQKCLKQLKSDKLLVRIGGPIQTMLTGILGLIILFYRRKIIDPHNFKWMDWLGVFLSLFWLREVFNLAMSVIGEIISPNGSFFGGDERIISELLNLWSGTISITLGLIGLFISVFIVFRVVPRHLRLTFILGGLLGSKLGLILWMDIFGPMLLP